MYQYIKVYNGMTIFSIKHYFNHYTTLIVLIIRNLVLTVMQMPGKTHSLVEMECL
jgi:hypothetical protein